MTNPEPTEATKAEACRRLNERKDMRNGYLPSDINPHNPAALECALSIDRETKAIAQRDEVLAMVRKLREQGGIAFAEVEALLARFTPPVDPLAEAIKKALQQGYEDETEHAAIIRAELDRRGLHIVAKEPQHDRD